MTDSESFHQLRTLEKLELAVVRAALKNDLLVDPKTEAALRTAISVARLTVVRDRGKDFHVEEGVHALRREVLKLLPVAGFADGGVIVTEKMRPIASILRELAVRSFEQVLREHDGLSKDALEREVRHKALVVASGGGGGAGYIYLGAFALLEEYGHRPALLAGTSMGAVLSLFRAHLQKFDHELVLAVLRSLSWGKLFRFLSMESRYGLPAALRLYLRAGIGDYFKKTENTALKLSELEIPLVVTVAGIRRGTLPRPVEHYEHLLDPAALQLGSPNRMRQQMQNVIGTFNELAEQQGRLDKLYLGLDKGTQDFDALDAVGFSSAVPGVIHYDIVRDDNRMHGLLKDLFAKRDLFRLVDGGVVDNVPVRAAWQGVQQGMTSTRNAFYLALDCFAPKYSTPLWLPLQRLVSARVQQNLEFAHAYLPFAKPLSPLELVPSVRAALAAFERGKAELAPLMPLVNRMLKPLPAF